MSYHVQKDSSKAADSIWEKELEWKWTLVEVYKADLCVKGGETDQEWKWVLSSFVG